MNETISNVFCILLALIVAGSVYTFIGYIIGLSIDDSDKELMLSYIVLWPVAGLVHIVKAIFRSFKRW